MPPKKKVKTDDAAPLEPIFKGLKFAYAGLAPSTSTEVHIRTLGGAVSTQFSYDITHLVSTAKEVAARSKPIQNAVASETPIVSESFVLDAISTGSLPSNINDYLLTDSKKAGDSEETEDMAERRTTKAKQTLEEADASAASSTTKKATSKATSAPSSAKPKKSSGPVFGGLTIVMSGTLSMPRKKFEDLIKANGGKIGSSVTSTTSYLVSTEHEVRSPTVKAETAIVNGVPIVSEDFVTDCVFSGAIPDPIDDKYLLHGGSGSGSKSSGSASSHSAPAAPSTKTAKKAATGTSKMDVDSEESGSKGPVFAGVTFAISGTLSLPRKQIEALVTRNGGKVASSVNRSVQYLITTDEDFEEGTSKVQAAMDADLPILTEQFLHDSIASGSIPANLGRYKCGDEKEEDEDEDGDDEEKEGGDEDEDGEDDEEDEDDEDDEEEEEEEKVEVKNLDPGLPPYHGPCIVDTLPVGIFQLLCKYLKLHDLLSVYRTGGMRRQLRFSLESLDIVLPDPTNLHWPKCISYFASLKNLRVSCPEYYTHLPLQNFDALSISPTVSSLTLAFGNAYEIFNQLKFDLHFRSLDSLEISGNQIDRSFFSVASSKLTPASLNGLTEIKLERLEIGAEMIGQLPRTLKHISGLRLSDGESPVGASFDEGKCKLPPKLEFLDVTCGKLGGLVMKSLSSISSTLRSLSLSCTVDPLIKRFPMDDKVFSSIPGQLHTLSLAVAGTSEGPFTVQILKSLPDSLTSLRITQLPFVLKTADIAQLARLTDLVVLRLPDIDAPTSEVLTHVPPGVTDLRLWSTSKTAFDKDCLPLLPAGLVTLEMNFENDTDQHFTGLPRSIEHLRCDNLSWDYGDGDEEGVAGDDKAKFPPNLKTFRYTCDYQFVYVALKRMPSTLVSFIADGDVDWEGDKMTYPKQLQVFACSSSNICDEFLDELPKRLKSYGLTVSGDSSFQDGSLFKHLPRRLAAFEMFMDEGMDISVAHVKKLPKQLAQLHCEARSWTKKHFEALPKTLGELRIPAGEYKNVSMADIPKLLPAHCRVTFVESEH